MDIKKALKIYHKKVNAKKLKLTPGKAVKNNIYTNLTSKLGKNWRHEVKTNPKSQLIKKIPKGILFSKANEGYYLLTGKIIQIYKKPLPTLEQGMLPT